MPFILQDTLGNPWSLVIDPSTGAQIATPVVGVTPSAADNAITTNAVKVIGGALRLIGVQAAGEPVDIEAANDGLESLQQMTDAWNADGRVIFTTTASDYALIPGQQTYTLGPGGDFDTNRPAAINSMSIILLNNPLNPIEVQIGMYSVDDWQRIPVKNVNGSFPQICYDTGDFPLRELNMWPIPTQANRLRIYGWAGLGIPLTLQSGLAFPPAYAEAFRYNLALRLAPEFSAQVAPIVAAIAVESLARIKVMNAPDLQLTSDLAAGGGYNYAADMFGLPYGGRP